MLIPYYWSLLIGIFIGGFCVGINSVLIPLYIKEMSPLIILGLTGSFY